MKIINKSKRDRAIPGRNVVILPPMGEMIVDDAEFRHINKYTMFRNWVECGFVDVRDDNYVAPPPPMPEPYEPVGVEIEEHSNGWYSVHVNGFKVTDVKVRREEAERIAAEYDV